MPVILHSLFLFFAEIFAVAGASLLLPALFRFRLILFAIAHILYSSLILIYPISFSSGSISNTFDTTK